MAAHKLLGLLALAFVAIVTLSSGPLHANALVADRAQVVRHAHAHDAVAKRKRDSPSSSGRCKPRSSSLPPSPLPTSTTPTSITPTSITPTSTTPPATSPTTSSAAQSTSGARKPWCLGWPNDGTYLTNFAFPNVGYLYTWSPYLPSGIQALGIQGIPMLWGPNQVDQFQQLVVSGYAEYVLGFNEPNEPSQSNLSPQDAYGLWMQYINPLADQGYHLISPACTDDDSGLTWYQEFFALCQGSCHVDSIAFHAYTTDAQHLIDYATTLHNTYGLPVWITEFADQNYSGTGGQPALADVETYAQLVTSFVWNTDWVMGACPFGAMLDLQGVDTYNSLMNSDGTPTSLAYEYFS